MELQSSRPLLSFLYLLPLCFELLMWRLFCVFHVCECLHRGINPLAAEHCFRRWFERLTCVFGWAAALQRWCLGCDADLVVLFLAVVCSNCGFCSERSGFFVPVGYGLGSVFVGLCQAVLQRSALHSFTLQTPTDWTLSRVFSVYNLYAELRCVRRTHTYCKMWLIAGFNVENNSCILWQGSVQSSHELLSKCHPLNRKHLQRLDV